MTGLAAITGASGFVGSHVVSAFVVAGWRCRILLRSGAAVPLAEAEIVEGALDDTASLVRLVDGADAVIHVAGLTASRDPADFGHVNADGTAAMAEAWARAAPAARFVLVSSLAAREPELSPYATSKRRAEEHLAKHTGHWCILRPSAVYGTRDAATRALFRMARAPLQPLFGPEDAQLCLVHAEDLARAVVAAAEHAPQGVTWEISDTRRSGYGWREMAATLTRTLGGTPRPVALPPWLVDALGFVAERVPGARRLLGPLSAGKIRELRHRDWSSSADAQPPPAIWAPRFSLAEGFERTLWAFELERGRRRRRRQSHSTARTTPRCGDTGKEAP
ncbi:MAG: NAD-dependent epimerase/dehydratase family protein [Pseudomonadota bacterium]